MKVVLKRKKKTKLPKSQTFGSIENVRLLEDGDTRITESGETRILE